MTSTRCAMKERSALIWFSCFCWASENFSRMPASAAALRIEFVLAVRHSLSAPIWLNSQHDLVRPVTRALVLLAAREPQARRPARRTGRAHAEFFSSAFPSQSTPTSPGAKPAAATASGLTSVAPSAGQLDLELIAGLHLNSVCEAQRRRAEEMQMHVARHAMRSVFEMMELQVGERVTHVPLACQEWLSQRTVSPRRMRLRPSRSAGSGPVRSSGPTLH